jgi:excisionase family DNA binding protein
MRRSFQFDMRENPASDRRHGSRLAASPSHHKSGALSASAYPDRRSPEPMSPNRDTFNLSPIQTPNETTGGERSDTGSPSNVAHTFVEPQENASSLSEEYPLTLREAAKYLGVSPQSVYLWVERKQIPHLRVMGRNIRFLKSDLETFRASFKQEMENA